MIRNILVTGAGGDIAQSIAKILRSSNICKKLIGTDVGLEHSGKFFFDDIMVVPKANEPNYLEEMTKIILQNAIDIIIPVSEAEIVFFLNSSLTEYFAEARVIMANKKSIEIGLDKLSTIKFLQENNLPYPKTEVASKLVTPFFPAIMKDRRGSGGKNILKLYEPQDFDFYVKKYPEYIFQEMLLPDEQEYTCGLYNTRENGVKTIIFKRKLKGGLTGYGTLVQNKEIAQILENLADLLELDGSINVQLRLVDGIPFIFEINPRFSSTVRFRHLLGFTDLIWVLNNRIGIANVIDYEPIKKATIHKVYEEYVEL